MAAEAGFAANVDAASLPYTLNTKVLSPGSPIGSTRNASGRGSSGGAVLASPRAFRPTIVRVNQNGRHHTVHPWASLERTLPEEPPSPPSAKSLR